MHALGSVGGKTCHSNRTKRECASLNIAPPQVARIGQDDPGSSSGRHASLREPISQKNRAEDQSILASLSVILTPPDAACKRAS